MGAWNGGGRPRLGDLLVERGRVTPAAIDQALAEQGKSGKRLGECLLHLGYLREEDLLASIAEQLGLETIDLSRLDAAPQATRLLPLEFVRAHRIVPLAVGDGVLRIATSDPGRAEVIDDVRLLSGLEVEEVVAPQDEIMEKISDWYQITVERLVEDLETGAGSVRGSDSLHDIEVMASEPTVVNLVNLILSTALRERASDVHLVPFEDSLELRYRIDGILHVVAPPPKHLHAAIVSRVKIMADMNIAERFLPQDGHIQIRHGSRRVDIRVGTMPTIYGESLVMRLLEKNARVHGLEELGFDAGRARAIERLVEKPHGIFLATGPTGSGKTTTLYSVLSGLYTTEKKILTIEDPVEYELPGVVQIPVRPHRGFTFASGLRAILRQDPDIIMVGEIRDVETAEIAIRAALTGHLVFSTLHTNDAPGAVTRLADMGIEPFLISSSLEAALAQRLVRRICGSCRAEASCAPDVAAKLERLGVDPSGPAFRGAGCRECRETGYRGRIGLFELLILDGELREMVVAKRSSVEIRARAARNMSTIREDGVRKAREGVTTFEEVLRVAVAEETET